MSDTFPGINSRTYFINFDFLRTRQDVHAIRGLRAFFSPHLIYKGYDSGNGSFAFWTSSKIMGAECSLISSLDSPSRRQTIINKLI